MAFAVSKNLASTDGRITGPRRRPVTFAVSVAVASFALAGCGLSTVTSGLSGAMFGSSKEKPPAVAAVTEEQLLSAAKAEYGEGGVNVGNVAHGCPEFAIWPTEHHTTAYEPGMAGDSLAVRHRAEITRTARECAIGNGQVSVKYGFSGRVLLGPRGQAGRVTLPVNVFVEDGNRRRLTGEDLSVSVDVSLENPIGYFSVVRTVSFAVPQGTRPGEYKVYVGLKTMPAT